MPTRPLQKALSLPPADLERLDAWAAGVAESTGDELSTALALRALAITGWCPPDRPVVASRRDSETRILYIPPDEWDDHWQPTLQRCGMRLRVYVAAVVAHQPDPTAGLAAVLSRSARAQHRPPARTAARRSPRGFRMTHDERTRLRRLAAEARQSQSAWIAHAAARAAHPGARVPIVKKVPMDAHRVTIRALLTADEYAPLARAAQARGTTVGRLMRSIIAASTPTTTEDDQAMAPPGRGVLYAKMHTPLYEAWTAYSARTGRSLTDVVLDYYMAYLPRHPAYAEQTREQRARYEYHEVPYYVTEREGVGLNSRRITLGHRCRDTWVAAAVSDEMQDGCWLLAEDGPRPYEELYGPV